jgi:hypothetical protein
LPTCWHRRPRSKPGPSSNRAWTGLVGTERARRAEQRRRGTWDEARRGRCGFRWRRTAHRGSAVPPAEIRRRGPQVALAPDERVVRRLASTCASFPSRATRPRAEASGGRCGRAPSAERKKTCGRLAQLGEQVLYTDKVGGSSPSSPRFSGFRWFITVMASIPGFASRQSALAGFRARPVTPRSDGRIAPNSAAVASVSGVCRFVPDTR